jgi:multiple sugar transport system ATP-binding protein
VDGKYKLGFRAEDGKIVKSVTGDIKGPIFSIELLGDATMVTVKIEENLISVKMSNTFNASIGDVVSVLISSSKCQVFDDKTGFNLS